INETELCTCVCVVTSAPRMSLWLLLLLLLLCLKGCSGREYIVPKMNGEKGGLVLHNIHELRSFEESWTSSCRIDFFQEEVHMTHQNAHNLRKRKPSHENVECHKNPREVESLKANPKHETHHHIGVLSGPDIDYHHNECHS